jgi:diguanylate cyclase (GGDEF)-like protein
MVRDYRRRLMAAEEELAQFRALDPVTGAGTYSQLKASLDSELARSRRYGRPVACLMFGFDDYQNLRYQLGRDACDGYLGSIVRELRTALRGADRLFRVDSDEFVALLPETDAPGAAIVARRVIEGVRKVDAQGQSGKIEAIVRCGVAVFPNDRIRSSEDLLREANRSYRELRNTTLTVSEP